MSISKRLGLIACLVLILMAILSISAVPVTFGSGTISMSTPHKHNEYISAKIPPTCGSTGFVVFKCKLCGKIRYYPDSFHPATGKHEWHVNYTITMDCKKKQDGKIYWKCSKCGQSKVDTFPYTHKLEYLGIVNRYDSKTRKTVKMLDYKCLNCGTHIYK